MSLGQFQEYFKLVLFILAITIMTLDPTYKPPPLPQAMLESS